MSRPTLADALRVPAFRWLFTGQAVSAVGDQVFPVAVTAAVLLESGGARELGVVLAARSAALVVFALLGGVWADRLPRVRVMAVADAVRLAVVGALALVSLREVPSWPVLALLVFVVGAGEAFSRPAYGALVPTVLPASRLAAGNALTGASEEVARVAGPGLAGLLLLLSGPSAAFAVDAATFGISLLTLVRVAEPPAPPPERRRTYVEVAEGVRAVREQPWIGGLMVMQALQLLFSVAPVLVLLPVTLHELGGSGSTYGLVLAVGGAGGLLGVLVAGAWQPRHPGRTGLLWLLAWALPAVALLLDVPVPWLALSWFVGMLGVSPYVVWWETALQEAVPRALLARVVSLDWLLSLSLLPVGLALVGPAERLLGRGGLLGMAVGAVLGTCLLPLRWPGVRDLRTERPPPRLRGVA